MMIEIVFGVEMGWYFYLVFFFGILLEGELEVIFLNGQKKFIKIGDVIVEVVNIVYNGCNVGEGFVKILVFYVGVKDLFVIVKDQFN